MRSRYCAFVMQDADYLIKTWHPSCGAAALRAELIAGFAHTEWLGLTVFEHCWQDGAGPYGSSSRCGSARGSV
ncbi:YchJ family metal-binding protein, partial [Pseudomonas aeruginosa]|uniref:YchJ family metal-binding protein n=1 Tax=Pseudomonas aeruginosa TaxID=287 RepID=UPI003D188503